MNAHSKLTSHILLGLCRDIHDSATPIRQESSSVPAKKGQRLRGDALPKADHTWALRKVQRDFFWLLRSSIRLGAQ